jgi:hypothetical protein
LTLVLKKDFLSYSVKVSRRIAAELSGKIGQLSHNALKGGVGEILCKNASPGAEHHYQPGANRLVFPACAFRIRTQPTQKPFKGGGVEPTVNAPLSAPR